MPDPTTPRVAFVVKSDAASPIIDWTIEEYQTDLGLIPPVAGFGGCSLYDTVNRRYVSYTYWNHYFKERLRVSIKNFTDVDVLVDWYDIQYFHSAIRLPKRGELL